MSYLFPLSDVTVSYRTQSYVSPNKVKKIHEILNRGRNLKLKNETTKFCPLFLCCKAYICMIFEYLFFIVELGHQEVKIRKSQRKNENGLIVNPEFSFWSGYLFRNS